ncbi:kinase-like protein [Roridomyces roridus]|uniref:Kinase-like protein n=1 Tax=Roridomyces roridus TaxID=1738132 RepID=A0AAD7B6L7_9AGAR|nr:kinase-like protein [Roridomyces roridus]
MDCSPPSSSSSVDSSPSLSGLSSSTSTSLSSAFSGSDFSSLPSPSVSPAPRESLSDIISPGAKTHAFFASPFSTRPPSPLVSPPSINGSTPITPKPPSSPVKFLTQSLPATPPTPEKRHLPWLDLQPNGVGELSSVPTPMYAQLPDDDTTPRLPSTIPSQVHEELAVGSIIRARTAPPRSRSVSTDNSGILTSSDSVSSSPLTQSPASQVSGLPEVTTPYTLSFPGLPLDSLSDTGAPMLTVEPPPSSDTILRLVKQLGTGAFSSVWLADDLSDDPLVLRSRRSLRNLRRQSSMSSMSLSRTSSLRKVRVPGVRPLGAGKRMLAEQERSGTGSWLQTSSSASALNSMRLVALKMTARSTTLAPVSGREEELQRDRTRVSFVREVEVLRHISHPNITKLLTHLTTPSYHVLVMPYVAGGDLLGVVNNDETHNMLSESLLRRMWTELCKAVGWMHGVGLVHRDVKLENILLTTTLPCATLPSGPLLKLTDFGLSRFIDVDSPLLNTRCGSEAYAAPELVISGRKYDGRETDAWACGVVLYALCTRRLPFGEGVSSPVLGGRINREGGARESAAARRHWLMSIARGEYEWPEVPTPPVEQDGEEGPLHASNSGDSDLTVCPSPTEDKDGYRQLEEAELTGPRLLESAGARGVVARLLVRDPSRRAKISELWDDPWMGGSSSEARLLAAEVETQSPTNYVFEYGGDYDGDLELEVEGFEGLDFEEDEEDLDDDGLLLDQDGIDSIARQEVQ